MGPFESFAAAHPSVFGTVFSKIAAHLGLQDLVNFARACPATCLPLVWSEDLIQSQVEALLRRYAQVDGFDPTAVLSFITGTIFEVIYVTSIFRSPRIQVLLLLLQLQTRPYTYSGKR